MGSVVRGAERSGWPFLWDRGYQVGRRLRVVPVRSLFANAPARQVRRIHIGYVSHPTWKLALQQCGQPNG